MIDRAEIVKVLEERIIASGSFPRVAWPNRDYPKDRPFMIFDLVHGLTEDATIDQSLERWTGYLVFTAVIDINIFARSGQGLTKLAGELFPAKLRMTMDSGIKLLCPEHPISLPEYRDGMDYRCPIRINLRTER